ncbi:SDR family oxidoreductase [Falsiroseomonas oryzae]|uniref:SDR family oxidoreductase n=1 Tax=Falsiroseomonas oryzae TaxID=2766473 RepID=UPI0022EB2D74|nr:SDR family oxidoreductase [Roseomonas sp. MO-31]
MAEWVLVTGGSQGIGRAVAARCAAEGWRVLTLDREAPAAPLPGETHMAVDLADTAATAEALAKATAERAITRLVNNVGTVRPGTLAEASLPDLDAVLALNLRCAIQCAQALLPGMQAARMGRIVSIASRAMLGLPARTAYAAAKAALVGATRSWAAELAPHGITANVVAPASVDTPLWQQLNPPGSPRRQKILDSVPMGRLASPEDVAQAVAFFLDARSGYVTGQTLFVCGGQSAGGAMLA